MPKIKPETKVLIIKNLKSKSPAEVADIFNVSKRQVERIRKRYQETGDVHDRPRSGRPHKTTAREDSLLSRSGCLSPVCRHTGAILLQELVELVSSSVDKREEILKFNCNCTRVDVSHSEKAFSSVSFF
ncbi:hypothetical protein AAFF_G00271950 [Aldrovandia affinis]|uniref:Transposase n=1 Tax=Aldrovandia affinis TaxID=143900 RepID=A0AAD7W236_9TELE|nr:hypothetical protein AAFF_G00271950 [Aldrovandia affinis]